MNQLGWLTRDGRFSQAKTRFLSQGWDVSLPFFGDSIMHYEIESITTPSVPSVVGKGCLLALMGIR